MAGKKVLITDPVAEVCPTILKEKGLDVDLRTGLTAQQIGQIIEPYHGLIVRSGTRVTAEIIERAHNLQVIGRAGVGVDNIDVTTATRHNIAVLNAASANTISTAEHTLALMLALARKIPQAHQSLMEGRWERSKFKGVELFGKTLGIVGLGKVGREVAKRARALGMQVLAFDPFLTTETFQELKVESCTLEEIFRRSDFVTVHVPLSEETRNLIDHRHFENCKPGLRLINAARGGVVNETALYQALTSGKIAGAALDVFEVEPPRNNPLLQLDNVVATPHLGASTEEAQVRVAEEIARLVANFLVHKKAENIVNPEVLKK